MILHYAEVHRGAYPFAGGVYLPVPVFEHEVLFHKRGRCQKSAFHSFCEPLRYAGPAFGDLVRPLDRMRLPLGGPVSEGYGAYPGLSRSETERLRTSAFFIYFPSGFATPPFWTCFIVVLPFRTLKE